MNQHASCAAHLLAAFLTATIPVALPAAPARAQCLRTIQYEEGPIADSIRIQNQTQCYVFAGTAGDRVRLNRRWNGSQILLVAEILDPTNAQVVYANEATLQVDCTLTVTGTHRVLIRDRDQVRTGDYTFQVKKLNGLSNCWDLCYGFEPTPGRVDVATREVCYKFPAKAGSTVRVNRSWNGSVILLVAEILDPNGMRVAYINEASIRHDFSPTADATYTLLIRDRDLARLGDFTVRLECRTLTPQCSCQAFARNYGAAWPGTGGRSPEMTASAAPQLGTSITLMVANSSGVPMEFCFLFIGLAQASIATQYGGTLHLVPTTAVVVNLPANGLPVPLDIPNNPLLCDAAFYFQAVQVDAAASHGWAFGRGLNLVFGL